MAPEQAGGDVALVDRRADVFGLGSILCEIPTGHPAYAGRTQNEVMRRAIRGDTGDALAGLASCGADGELIAPAKDCLAAEPEHRPRDAPVVADRVAAHLAGVQQRRDAAARLALAVREAHPLRDPAAADPGGDSAKWQAAAAAAHRPRPDSQPPARGLVTPRPQGVAIPLGRRRSPAPAGGSRPALIRRDPSAAFPFPANTWL